MTEPEKAPAPKEKKPGSMLRKLVFWTAFVSGSWTLFFTSASLIMMAASARNVVALGLVAALAAVSPLFFSTALFALIATTLENVPDFVGYALYFAIPISAIGGLVANFFFWRVPTTSSDTKSFIVFTSIIHGCALLLFILIFPVVVLGLSV